MTLETISKERGVFKEILSNRCCVVTAHSITPRNHYKNSLPPHHVIKRKVRMFFRGDMHQLWVFSIRKKNHVIYRITPLP
ncbi:MAG: hypothetical protein AAF349_12720 [Cyanobacteria bacterium P01_A01_bin.68]